MKTIENPNIRTVVKFIVAQMDGEQVPTSSSAELASLAASVEAIQAHASTLELRELGLHAIGAVIARVQAAMGAEKALRDFIQPGGDHA